MIGNISKYKKDVERLDAEGLKLEYSFLHMHNKNNFTKEINAAFGADDAKEIIKNLPKFNEKYEAWYGEALALIRQLMPDRKEDFVRLYEKPKARKNLNHDNYTIQDAIHGIQNIYEDGVKPVHAINLLRQQINILKACSARFESSLFDIKQLVQADLLDSELDAARELHKNKFLRAAGAVAGVVLEKHLVQVIENHNLKLVKKNPSISDYNEILKANSVIEIPQWRHIGLMADIRNLCDHNKQKEPTSDQVMDLIDGVNKITKTIY